MTSPESTQIRNLQIIAGSLLFGAGTVLIVVTFLVMTGEKRGDPGNLGTILLGVWAALAAGGLLVWPLLRNKQAAQATAAIGGAAGDEGRLEAVQRYSTLTIVGAALAEGTTLLAAAGGFVTGHPGLLAAGLVGLVGVVLLFPSQTKFERFLERGISHRNV